MPVGYTMAMALERELATFKKLFPSLTGQEGQFALVSGEEILGVFDSYSDALKAGYKERGLEPFLVKRISAVEEVANFSRDLRFECTAQTL